MAAKHLHGMKRAISCAGILSLAFLTACGDKADRQQNYQPTPFPADASPAYSPEPTALVDHYEPHRPSHYYDERNGPLYSYIAAVSEEDRKAGRAAGDVVTFAYLGESEGRHVLVQVLPNGAIAGRSSCRKPCRVITHDDGTQVGYTESSIIGAAFADALAGEMVIARQVQPTRAQPPASPSPVSTPSNTEDWSPSELALIDEWRALNQQCQGGTGVEATAAACERRDEAIAAALDERDICYGRVYEAASEQTVHRCTGDSLHFATQ